MSSCEHHNWTILTPENICEFFDSQRSQRSQRTSQRLQRTSKESLFLDLTAFSCDELPGVLELLSYLHSSTNISQGEITGVRFPNFIGKETSVGKKFAALSGKTHAEID
jgi:hypothetical protein